MEQNWRENVHRRVGNPNGQLARIEFDQSSWYGGSEGELEGQCLVHMLQYYDYENEDGTASISYNTKPDDTCVVSAWSEADIVTPRATAIKDWYVYLPDDPRCKSDEIWQDPCQECLEGDCTDCFPQATYTPSGLECGSRQQYLTPASNAMPPFEWFIINVALNYTIHPIT